MKGKISQQTHACPRALCAMRAQGSASGMLRMKLGWYSQSSGLGNHPIHIGMHVRVHAHTHTHTHIPTFWNRVLILFIVSTHEENQEPMEVAETASHLQMFFFFLSEKLVFDFCSKQTYHTTPLLWLPALTNEPSLYSLSEEKKKKKSAPSLIPRPPTQMLISLPVLTLFSGFQVLSLSPASILFIFPNLTVMDQVLCGI